MCVCVCVCVCGSLKLTGWRHKYLTVCIYKYVCGFLKLANLSTLIFDRFFLKKKKNWQVVEIVGKKLKKKKEKTGGCWKLTVGIVEFEKEITLMRNNKERLKNNILIKL